MKVRYLKYLLAISLPLSVAISFNVEGWLTFLPAIYAFGLLPILELLSRPDPVNLTEAESEIRKNDRVYDYLLYAMVPIQYAILTWFLFAVSGSDLSWITITGRTIGMGLMCGVIGINVAHELGHRRTKYEQWMSKALLLTTQYMHFFIEHNRGHHKHVATPNDPATARKNEWLHLFLIRTVVGGYRSAWSIELTSLKRRNISPWSLSNEMLRYTVIQLGMLIAIAVAFSPLVMLYACIAAAIGVLLLETVNYIEHYGLSRQEVSPGKFERTMPHHSWNSDHVLGRLMLFELSRHSDHHFIASKKYQVLEHYDDAPQMPTGYPGMVLLACFPPLWFSVMNPRVEHWREHLCLAAQRDLERAEH
jgi:alkane 1-monooxygenase